MATHEVQDRRVYAPGEIVFKEGEVSRRCAYLVEKGSVDIVKTLQDGTTTVLGTIAPGGIFGEMALIDNKPRMAMARTAEPTTLIIITGQLFEDKLRKADPFIRALLNIFVRTIRGLTDKAYSS